MRNAQVLTEKYPEFVKVLESVQLILDTNKNKKNVSVDQYMKDLRKHAQDEYGDLIKK
jgi:hypothetical protein